MAPTNLSTKENLILRGVNLKKRNSLLQSIDDLIDYRSQFIEWKEEVSYLVQNDLSIPLTRRMLFSNYDDVVADYGTNGGVGTELNSERAKKVMHIIRTEISKCIEFLSDTEMNDNRLVTKKSDGSFYYGSKSLRLNLETHPYVFLDIMLHETDDGYLSYTDIAEKMKGRVTSKQADIDDRVVKGAKSSLFAESGLPKVFSDGREFIKSHNNGYKIDNRKIT